jgi:hypothetical protein
MEGRVRLENSIGDALECPSFDLRQHRMRKSPLIEKRVEEIEFDILSNPLRPSGEGR